MEEPNFPRGGTVLSSPGGKKRHHAEEKDLFQTGDVPAKKRKKSKVDRAEKKVEKAKQKKKDARVEGHEVLSASISTPATLNAGVIVPSLLVLGAVKEVQDYCLVVSLPNGVEGRIAIPHICDAYTGLLQQLTEENDHQMAQEVASLDELFHPGMTVCCKVLSISGNVRKKRLPLTLNPREVNQSLTSSQLKGGLVLPGCVSSCEDHGYVVDLGVPGITAFLKKKAAAEYIEGQNEGRPLSVGSYLHCMISANDRMDMMTGECRTVNVLVNPRKVHRSQLSSDLKLSLQMLMPGMPVKATVSKVTDEGVLVKVLTYSGSIHYSHLQEPTRTYKKGQELNATILFINPTSKAVSLSTLTPLVTPDLSPRRLFGDIERGSILEGEVLRSDKQRGVYLKLNEHHQALTYKTQLSDKPVTNLQDKFPVGSKHRCRVLGFDYADNVVVVTMKASTLEQQFMQYSDILTGDTIEGTVRGLHKRGLSVDVTAKLSGFVPHIHMADVILHHPEKKFTKGDKIKCKVLVVDPSERKLTLTCKKSMLRSKNPSLTSYQQATPGLVVDGVITKIDKKGCLVVFYNNVKGWVPVHELSTEKIQFPEKAFFVGQVAKCRILSVSPETGRMLLSFKDVGKAAAGSKMAARPADFEIGKVVSCRVVKAADQGLDVVLLPSELPAFVPTMHLSDFSDLRPLVKTLYKAGDVIEEAMYLEASSVITLTLKHSLVQAAKEDHLAKDFSSLRLGDIFPGTITKHMNYGMFVDLTHKIVGLAPNKFLYDRKLPPGTCLYHVGQSVVAKVTEVDTERRRLLLSLRMVDCYHGNIKYGIDILQNYLTEYKGIMKTQLEREELNPALHSLTLGSVIKVSITEVTDQGVLCQLEGGVSGFAVHEHLKGVVCKKGQSLDAVVLYVDPGDGSVEVALSADLVMAVKGRSRNKYSQVERGQTLKSEVLMVRNDFILVHLKQHGKGQMAFLPAKRLFNDVLEKHQYVVGQENPVVIKRADGGEILASLKLHEDSSKDNTEEDSLEKAKLGTITAATISHVGDQYLYVKVGGTAGRVHISEVVDAVSDGVNPLSQHSVEEKVRVKIIAVKHVKKNQEFPDGIEKCKTYYDCTMKPSKLMRAGFRKADNPHKKSYKKNQAVNVFVDHFHSPCLHVVVSELVRGKVYMTNLSDDLAVLQQPQSHFVPGQAYLAHVLAIKDNSKLLELTLTSLRHDMSEGQVVTGVLSQSTREDFLIVNLSGGYRGRVSLTDLSDEYHHLPLNKFSQNELVQCCVLYSKEKTRCTLSLRPSRTNPDGRTLVKDAEVSWASLRSGQVIRGYVVGSSAEKGVWVSLARDISCHVNYDHLSCYYIHDIEGIFYVGKVVTVAILSVDTSSQRCELSLLEEHTGVKEDIPADIALTTRSADPPKRKAKSKAHNAQEDVGSKVTDKLSKEDKKKEKKKEKKKRKPDADVQSIGPKRQRLKEDDHDSGLDSEQEVVVPEVKVETSGIGQTMPHLSLSAGFSWDASLPLPSQENEAQSDSEDESDEEETVGQAKKPKSRAEKMREKKEEEKRVFQREHELLDQQRSPDTAEDFDRLVLQSPDSSIVWLRYMAFHLETAEIEKARAVAERALKTISFREEQEKLNIWVAYLNLENMYGTHESLNDVFKEALQRNEPIKVFQQLIAIYANSGKIESAEQLYDQMVRRFSLNKDVWTSYGLFLFKNTKADMARKVMQRSLKSLDKRDHLEVIAKFAQIEFKHGEPERGKTMFENILSNYGKRNDLWLVYIDMVAHLGEHDTARKLFERAIGISFSAKKMKSIFKKYLDFETKHGNEDTVANVKQKALEYVTAKTDVE